jgi:eukaryotic-like serine/threonine-protein kinase
MAAATSFPRAVLYEMLTGRRAFEGQSQLSAASAILEKDPTPITSVKPMTPPALDHVIRKCLAKAPDERWQSASDLASELKWIAESAGSAAGTVPRAAARKMRETVAWVVSGTLAVLVVVAALWWRNPRPSGQAMQFLASIPFPARDVALSPNGHTVAVVAYWESAREILGKLSGPLIGVAVPPEVKTRYKPTPARA